MGNHRFSLPFGIRRSLASFAFFLNSNNDWVVNGEKNRLTMLPMYDENGADDGVMAK